MAALQLSSNMEICIYFHGKILFFLIFMMKKIVYKIPKGK